MSETYQPVAPDKASGMAIAALVLGILGAPCCCGIFAALPALIVGFIEFGRINRGTSSQKGKTFAIIGMILGIIFSLLGCIQLIWMLFFGGLNVLRSMSHSHF